MLAPPDANDEVHGDEHGFPEDEKQAEIQGQERPSIAVSNSSMKTANSLTFVVMLCQDPSKAIGESNVVRSTSGRLMPSTPM